MLMLICTVTCTYTFATKFEIVIREIICSWIDFSGTFKTKLNNIPFAGYDPFNRNVLAM